MRALDDLRQLTRIADQHDVARTPAHGDHIGKPHLAGLIDEQPIERLLLFGPGKKEGRAADHMGTAP